MYLLIITLPFINFLFLSLLGRKLGIKGSIIITLITYIINSILSIIILYELGINSSIMVVDMISFIEILDIN